MNMFENATTYQSAIIYTSFGFSNLTTTLLLVVQNGFSTYCALVCSFALFYFKKQGCIVGAGYMMPTLVGVIIAIAIGYENKAG